MKIFEFAIWWLGQGENFVALVAYCLVTGFATVIAFFNSVLIGILFLVVFGSPVAALLIYVINKEIRKTYNGWLTKYSNKP